MRRGQGLITTGAPVILAFLGRVRSSSQQEQFPNIYTDLGTLLQQ